MKTALQIMIIIAAGILLGIGSFYYLAGWFNVIPWAIVSMVIGYRSKTTRESLVSGAIFGYFLFLTFIFVGYNGKTDATSLRNFILFDVGFSLIGALVGAGGSFAGFWLKKAKQ